MADPIARRRIPGSAAYIQWDPANPSWVNVSIAWVEPQSTGADANWNPVLAGGAVIPANYRGYQTRVFP